MNVLRSRGQPELIYVILTDSDARGLRKALKGSKGQVAKMLRSRLGAVLDAK